MSKINWKVRFQSKEFWIGVIAIMIPMITEIASLFGYEIHIEGIGDKLISIINLIFMLLGLMGVINDPTTKGLRDSKQALKYTVPKDTYFRPDKKED